MLAIHKGWKRFLGLSLLLIGAINARSMMSVNPTKQQRAMNSRAEAVEGEFVVQMKRHGALSKSALVKQLADVGMQLKSAVNASEKLYLVKVSDSNKVLANSSTQNIRTAGISLLSSLADVEYAEPNFIYRVLSAPESTPAGPLFNKLWAMKNLGQPDPAGKSGVAGADIKATLAWNVFQGSKEVVVAIIDTGVDYNHPALKDNIWTKAKADPSEADVHGFNAITGALDPMDDHSHGTHCAGTIGASGANPDGVVGVNWNVKIMGAKFLSGSGSGTLADAIKAIDWAVANGAQILSNSWGGGPYSEALLETIKRVRDKGVLFIAAAGNNGANNDNVAFYPANYDVDNVLPVAATDNSDGLAYFSNFGAKSVLIAAPGVNIWSTVPGSDKYASYSGTSMAAPHVSGAAALLLGFQPSLSYAEVKQRLMATADKVASLNKKVKGGNRLNIYNMLMNINPPAPVAPPDSSFSAVVPHPIDSDHPYKNGEKKSWRISHEGATYMRLKFGKFDTESGYDIITIKNAKGETVDSFSGERGDKGFVSADIDGDTAVIEWTSDSSVNRWGFSIEGYSWSAFKN